jgi:hypothetical protein
MENFFEHGLENQNKNGLELKKIKKTIYKIKLLQIK